MTEAVRSWIYSPGRAEARPDISCFDSYSSLSPLIIHPCVVADDEDGTQADGMTNVLGTEEQTLRRGCRENHGVLSVRLIRNRHEHERAQLSFLALLLAALRRSLLVCKSSKDISIEIGLPTNVRHVTHVTFDRFNGFLGLPTEFAGELPRTVPSASASVFGVSAESMQCSYDRRGNNVPTILLLIQDRLYRDGGLQAEGIFRINPENNSEEEVRQHLNNGVVPPGIDLHCLAGLIKAWFRELPKGVLDSLSPEELMQCSSEEQCVALAKRIPPTESALLDWAVNLMADVAQEEAANKMNAHGIAMVFAPNMTQMVDPLTALVHAVQVMNLLKALIQRTLWKRQKAGLYSRPYCLFKRSSLDDDSETDNASPFFLGYEYQETMSGEIIRETVMVPFNSPSSKYSPDESNSENDPDEDCFFECNEYDNACDDAVIHGNEGENGGYLETSSIETLKACNIEEKNQGHCAFMYPDKIDDNKVSSGEKLTSITDKRTVISRQKALMHTSKSRNRLLQDR